MNISAPTTSSATRKFNVLDLFCGCGGFSLGFHSAGFEIIAGVDNNKRSIESFSKNGFGAGILADLSFSLPERVLELIYKRNNLLDSIDLIIGGPPCQTFSRIGRAKLRELNSLDDALKNDERSKLYKKYLGFVKLIKPLAVVMENVPDILNFQKYNLTEKISKELESYGYKVRYTLLNSAYYGVPQYRERMFLIAYRRDLGEIPTFPLPTHRGLTPIGYNNW